MNKVIVVVQRLPTCILLFKTLTLSQTTPCFYMFTEQVFEDIVEKGEIALNEQFLLFPQCFLPILKLSAFFVKFEIVVCKLLEFGGIENLSFWKGLMQHNEMAQAK